MKKQIVFLFSTFAAVGMTAQTATFNYLGAPQYFVVPANVTSINVDVRGAEGGTASNMTQSPNTSPGGMGGRVTGTLSVNPGDTIWVYVGGTGMSTGGTLTCLTAVGGWNGGGTGYAGYNSYNYNSGGGGGASDLRFGGQSLNNRVMVAGGGGGAGCSGCTGGGLPGGHGGDTLGQDGGNTSPSCFPGCNNGKGGGQVFGGGFGQWACQCQTSNATAGTLGQGGAGDGSGCPVTCGSGGGGGGGYYGGGGGSAGPGGGGSNYASGAFSNVIHTRGFQAGNGQVIFDYMITSAGEIPKAPFSIQFSPNPVTQIARLLIHGKLPSAGTLRITDLNGKKLGEWKKVESLGMSLDLSAFAPGTYLVSLEAGNFKASHSFIKQ